MILKNVLKSDILRQDSDEARARGTTRVTYRFSSSSHCLQLEGRSLSSTIPHIKKKSCNTRSWNNVNAGNNEQLAKWTKVVLEFKHTLNAFVCVGNLSVPAWRSDFQITLVVFSIPLCGHIWLKVLHWVLWNCGILVYFKEVFSSMKSTAIEI